MGRLYANSMQFYTTDLGILDFGILGVWGVCTWTMPLGYRRRAFLEEGRQSRTDAQLGRSLRASSPTFRFSSTLCPHPSVPSPVLLSLSHPRAQSQTATRESTLEPSRGAVVTKSSMPKLQVHNCTNSKNKTEWAASERGNCHVRGTFCAIWESLAPWLPPPDVMQMSTWQAHTTLAVS